MIHKLVNETLGTLKKNRITILRGVFKTWFELNVRGTVTSCTNNVLLLCSICFTSHRWLYLNEQSGSTGYFDHGQVNTGACGFFRDV